MADLFLISLAFLSGIAAFFGPCGISMLPAYVSYILGLKKEKGTKKVLTAIVFGILATLGIISVYLFIGSIFSFGSVFIKPYIPLVGLILGVILVMIGVLVYFEKFSGIYFYHSTMKASKNISFNSFYLFGTGYGIAQLSCTLPIFLVVVSQALTVGSFLDGMFIFLIYGVGIGLGVIVVTIATILSREAVQKYINTIIPHLRKLTALLLVLSGMYQIYFQIAVNNVFALF